MRKSWVSLLVFLVSCAPVNVIPYINDFNSLVVDCPTKFKGVVTTFFLPQKTLSRLVGEDVIGVCSGNSLFRQVALSKEWYDFASEDDRRQLLYHEFTHCVLDVDHTDDVSNYMYYSLSTTMTKEQLDLQVKDVVQKTCNK